MNTVYSAGHSTLEPDAFLAMIRPFDVDTVIDIRSHPTSCFRQWRLESMEQWLPRYGVGYEWWPELGGYTERHAYLAESYAARDVDVLAYTRGAFPKQRIAGTWCRPPEGIRPPFWSSIGFWDYQFYMLLPEFQEGVRRLAQRAGTGEAVIICAESAFWRCHRSMVADALLFHGVAAVHVMPGRHEPRTRIHTWDRLDRYEPEVLESMLLAPMAPSLITPLTA